MRLGIGKKQLLLAAAVCSSLTGTAFAAAVDGDAVKTRDVVVSATRTEQEIKEVPASVEVITREDMERLGADSVVSALRLAASLNLSKAGMTGNQVSLRGMNTSQTLILVDGRRTASEDTSVTSNVYELDRINIENVERIEIVRGPVSSLYGSDALGGVINIIMKKPEEASGTMGLSTGSERRGVNLNFDFGKQGKWAWATDLGISDIVETKYDTGNTNMFGTRRFFNLSGIYDMAENKQLDVFFAFMNEDLKEKYDAGNKEYWKNKRNGYGVAYRGTKADGDYEMSLYYNQLTKDDKTYNANGVLQDFDDAKYTTFAVDGKNSTQIGDNHLLTVGAEYRQAFYQGTRLGSGGENGYETTVGDITKTGSEARIGYYAGYVQDEWVISDRLLIIPSLRYDGSDKFGDNVSPKIGLTYKMDDTYRLKASYGTGFKAPTISELYMNMTRTMGPMHVNVQGNPDLLPEESKSYEISLEAEKGANFGKLTYFHNDVDQLIGSKTSVSRVPGIGMLYTSKYVNIDKAKIDGIELEAGHRLNDAWSVKLTGNYLNAVDDTSGERLEDRFKHKATLQLIYDDTDCGVGAVLWNEWVNRYRYSSEDYSYSMLNFSVNKKFTDRIKGYAAIENIFDKHIEGLGVDGRVWRFGVQLSI